MRALLDMYALGPVVLGQTYQALPHVTANV